MIKGIYMSDRPQNLLNEALTGMAAFYLFKKYLERVAL